MCIKILKTLPIGLHFTQSELIWHFCNIKSDVAVFANFHSRIRVFSAVASGADVIVTVLIYDSHKKKTGLFAMEYTCISLRKRHMKEKHARNAWK